MKITISKENYLKTIAEAESEGEAVIAATLARWLKVSAPAVTMAIRRLKRDELIRVGRDGQITLTRSGRTIANRLLNRHHLIERMLTEVFGMEWYKVHEEAEQLEHAVSSDFESRLRETSLTRILGALIGCAIGLAIARAVGSALFWADNGVGYVVSGGSDRDRLTQVARLVYDQTEKTGG